MLFGFAQYKTKDVSSVYTPTPESRSNRLDAIGG
jgi:hypothetical protein